MAATDVVTSFHSFGIDLGVTWDFEIQLTWKFFNSLSDLVGFCFFQLTSKFCDSLFDLGLMVHLYTLLIYAPQLLNERISPHSADNRLQE